MYRALAAILIGQQFYDKIAENTGQLYGILPHYFEQAHNTNKTACIYIINDKTVAFIPTQQGITLLDSHYHGTSGAFVAMAPADAAWELFSWFKVVISIPHNLGTVTSVTF